MLDSFLRARKFSMRRGGLFVVQVALVITLAATMLATAVPSYAAGTDQPPAQAAMTAPGRLSEALAARAWTEIRNAARAEKNRGAGRSSVGYLPRLRKSLSPATRASLVLTTARAATSSRGVKSSRNRPRQVDADMRLGFRAGPTLSESCLSLRTGAVSPRPCPRADGTQVAPRLPRDIDQAYLVLYRALVWFDQRAEVYGATAQSAALVERLTSREYPGMVQAQVEDADADGMVDQGQVVITMNVAGQQQCSLVTLPQHDPTGQSYNARAERCLA